MQSGEEEQVHRFDFCTTHWSVVASAVAGSQEDVAIESLQAICEQYRPPLLFFLRRWGHPAEDAEDLVQSFLTRFLERGSLRMADRQRGQFRTFLLTSLKHFAANEWHKGQAAKRGGKLVHLELDETIAERISPEVGPAQEGFESPDLVFDRKWAELLMARSATRLQEEWEAAGKAAQFKVLSRFLSSEPTPGSYAELAPSLGCVPESVGVWVLRMRRRFGQLFRQEVAATVSRIDEVDAEFSYLVQLLL